MQGQSYYSIPFYVQFMKKNQLFRLDLNINIIDDKGEQYY